MEERREIDRFFGEALAPDCELGVAEEPRGVLEALLASARAGDLCLLLDEKMKRGLKGLPARLMEEVEGDSLHLPEAPVCLSGEYLYLQKNWVFETRVVHHLKRLLGARVEVGAFAAREDLTAEQNSALEKALKFPVSLISGGPGTGKTYTAARIVSAFLERKKDARILLAAPTGKAAKQLEQKNRASASTLHALLKIRKDTDFSEEADPLFADLILIDECSMLDAKLFAYFLSAVQLGTTLVLIGDRHQLPAIESGTLFADLLETGAVPATFLTASLRAEKSALVELADAVNRGDVEKTLALLPLTPIADEESLWRHVQNRFPSPYCTEIDPDLLWKKFQAFRLLSCVRKGPLGVDRVNKMLKKRFSELPKKGECRVAPILITKNDEERGLCNGESGILVCGESSADDFALFPGEPLRKIPAALLPPFEYAYCLSVHKSQGSEYDHVLLLVPTGSEHFGREVLYTGITRAKKGVEIAGSKEAIEGALARFSRKISGLHARLKS